MIVAKDSAVGSFANSTEDWHAKDSAMRSFVNNTEFQKGERSMEGFGIILQDKRFYSAG